MTARISHNTYLHGFYYTRISRMQSRNLIQIKEYVFIWNGFFLTVETNVYQLTLFCEFARF